MSYAMKKNLLIVEDDLSVQKLLKFLLTPRYNVTILSNGAEALFWWQKGVKVDLVISDVEMPLLGGLELVKKIGLDYDKAETPVILMSSNNEKHVRRLLKGRQIQAFLSKPIKPEFLLNAIDAVFGTYTSPSSISFK